MLPLLQRSLHHLETIAALKIVASVALPELVPGHHMCALQLRELGSTQTMPPSDLPLPTSSLNPAGFSPAEQQFYEAIKTEAGQEIRVGGWQRLCLFR